MFFFALKWSKRLFLFLHLSLALLYNSVDFETKRRWIWHLKPSTEKSQDWTLYLLVFLKQISKYTRASTTNNACNDLYGEESTYFDKILSKSKCKFYQRKGSTCTPWTCPLISTDSIFKVTTAYSFVLSAKRFWKPITDVLDMVRVSFTGNAMYFAFYATSFEKVGKHIVFCLYVRPFTHTFVRSCKLWSSYLMYGFFFINIRLLFLHNLPLRPL